MSKKSLDLDYMKDTMKVKSGIKAGAMLLYGIWWFPILAYGIITPRDEYYA